MNESATPALPGFPLIESPIFFELLAQGCFGSYGNAAKQLHTQGYLLLDLGRERMAKLAARIQADLAGAFDLDAWRASGAQADLRLQDAWRQSVAVRELALLPDLHSLLEQLWGRKPFAFQTLNFPVGTRQHFHSDAVHFHSDPAGFMCGVWVALEDIDPEAGPLEYFPGSHRLPYLQARDVGYHQGSGASPDQSIFHPYWQAVVQSQGLTRQLFTPRLGHALIWTANLLHGGAPVANPLLTRWSQVTHYFFEGCRWYTPMLSDWPVGPVAWRKPLDVACDGHAHNSVVANDLMARLADVLEKLAQGDLDQADRGLESVLEPWAAALPGAWRDVLATVEASGVWARLIPLVELRAAQQPDHPAWQRWTNAFPPRAQTVALDRLFRLGSGHYLVYGWRAAAGSPELVVRTNSGQWFVVTGDGPPLRRSDVAVQLGLPNLEDCGFVMRLQLPRGCLPQRIWLNGCSVPSGSMDLEGMPYLDFVDTLLIECQPGATPIERLPQLLHAALGPCLLEAREPWLQPSQWLSLIKGRHQYGTRASGVQPEITVVVPLYRRWDFVLGQVAGFAVDPWFQTGRAELLYVVDDPSIASEFLGWCEGQLCYEPLAITVLTLQRNTGFAMACNTGVLAADTPLVCLLNSDVLPIKPGWLAPLVKQQLESPRALVAPLLLYDNGLIQHAGMDVQRCVDGSELPACHHPLKGLHLDQLQQLSPDGNPYRVEALSGAALLFERQHYLDLGGFDPVFGRGDFEDLELSLRWQRDSGDLWMVPEAVLTHLERQSFSRDQDILSQWRQVVNAWLAKELCPEWNRQKE